MQKQSGMPQPALNTAHRRLDVRYVGPISGCYTLSDRREFDGRGVEVFACRTLSISPNGAAITAPVQGDVGDWLTARLDGLGIIRGRIERRIEGGFVFKIVGSDEQREKLAKSIDWLKRRNVLKRSDQREHDRFKPRDPRSMLGASGAVQQPCFVIDISRGGAAVSMRDRPEIGTPLVLGSLACTVVHHIDHGFAVKFDVVQELEGVEELVCGAPQPEQDTGD